MTPSLNQAGDNKGHVHLSNVDETTTGSIVEETCYGGTTALCRGPVAMAAVVTVSSEGEIQTPVPSTLHNDAPALNQTPGKSGLTDSSAGLVWKCLILGCGTANSRNDSHCANCQCQRPSAEQVRRAKVYRQVAADIAAREAQAVAAIHKEQLDNLRAMHDLQLQAVRAMHEKDLDGIRQNRDELQLQRVSTDAGGRGSKPQTKVKQDPHLVTTVDDESTRCLQISSSDEKHRRQPCAAAVLVLSQLNLREIATSGNACLLQVLDELGALAFIPGINEVRLFSSLLRGIVKVSYDLYSLLHHMLF